MIDKQYLSLGYLENYEFFSPTLNLEVFCTLTFDYGHVTCRLLVANLLHLDKSIGVSDRCKQTLLSTFRMNVSEG